MNALRKRINLRVFAAPLVIQQLPTFSGVPDVLRRLCTIVDYLFAGLLIAVIVFVVIAAYSYLTSGGNPEKVKSANHQLIYAAVALVVALFAKSVPLVVAAAVGFTFIGPICG